MAESESGRSSVTITVNAKGQHQWVVKVYAEGGAGTEAVMVRKAADLAIELEAKLAEKYGLPG